MNRFANIYALHFLKDGVPLVRLIRPFQPHLELLTETYEGSGVMLAQLVGGRLLEVDLADIKDVRHV